MAAIHFICRNFDGIEKSEAMPRYTSKAWVVSEDVAEKIVGANVYFHETKGEPSYFGGLIDKIERLAAPDDDRVIIHLTATKEGRGVRWTGADHDMAWTSGLVE